MSKNDIGIKTQYNNYYFPATGILIISVEFVKILNSSLFELTISSIFVV
jgi:hypothetical protein